MSWQIKYENTMAQLERVTRLTKRGGEFQCEDIQESAHLIALEGLPPEAEIPCDRCGSVTVMRCAIICLSTAGVICGTCDSLENEK